MLDEVVVPLLNPVIDHIEGVFDKYSATPSYLNCIEAANWCFGHGLVQQSLTILLEGICTYFCMRHGLDYSNMAERGLVAMALNNLCEKRPEEKWKFNKKEEDTPENRALGESSWQMKS